MALYAEESRPVTPARTVVMAAESFEDFYARDFKPVVALAYALSGNRASAEDLAQEAFLAAHRRWDKVGRLVRRDAWVRRVVANL